MTYPEWTSPDGRIRLINADCLDVLPTLEAGSVDAVVTDPPWNCGYFGESDDVSWGDYKATLQTWLGPCERLCEGQAWFLSTKSIPHVSDLFQGYRPFASVKNFSQMMASTLPNCWDIAFVKHGRGSYLGTGRNWFVANTAGMLKERTGHPTPRSVDVVQYIVGMFDWAAILDPFGGSMTTAVACVRTNRRCIAIEKEPKYFEVGIKRLEKEYDRTRLFDRMEATA